MEVTTDFPLLSEEKSHKFFIVKSQTCMAAKQLAASSVHTTQTEKVLNLATSLPVTSAFLAVLLSRGVSMNGELWMINYAALTLALLTLVGMMLSCISVPRSHDYCEMVFLAMYSPVTLLFNFTVNHRDIYENSKVVKLKAINKSPDWLKSLLFALTLEMVYHILSLQTFARAIMTTFTFRLMSSFLKRIQGTDEDGGRVLQLSLRTVDRAGMVICGALFCLEVALCPSFAFLNFLFFLMSDHRVCSLMQSKVQYLNIERMEGLEEYYAQSARCLIEACLAMVILCSQQQLSLILVPAIYFNVYNPLSRLKEFVKTIIYESDCLSFYHPATATEIAEYDDVCAVCLGHLIHARVTPCGHMFHGKCLKDCLKKKPLCPMCNTNIL